MLECGRACSSTELRRSLDNRRSLILLRFSSCTLWARALREVGAALAWGDEDSGTGDEMLGGCSKYLKTSTAVVTRVAAGAARDDEVEDEEEEEEEKEGVSAHVLCVDTTA
eukprot:TRINITY_DN3089_c0_g1_i7.p1 TRINITY_DN3089_c0_g1~~TRINITY_DN3089_c0_g1_i7.p1  ORF type:complete len:111 (+),score=9.38 TRINITY_DN3089_c0_g1_i7:450-782(+)